MIRIIAAIGRNGELGRDNSLLWRLPSDLANFRRVTTGHVVVMGRKTFDSIGRALPGRRNIVVTRNQGFDAEDIEVVNSLEEAFLLCNSDCFVIGGAEIYSLALSYAERIYLTRVDAGFDADAFFPGLGNEWVVVEERTFPSDERNEFPHSFLEMERCEF